MDYVNSVLTAINSYSDIFNVWFYYISRWFYCLNWFICIFIEPQIFIIIYFHNYQLQPFAYNRELCHFGGSYLCRIKQIRWPEIVYKIQSYKYYKQSIHRSKLSQMETKKKITISQLKRYLPIKPPSCSPRLPTTILRYLSSPTFSNLSITEQNAIKQKYDVVYRHYYAIQDIANYICQFTEGKYSLSSIKRAICNSTERYGVVDWFKFLRIVMQGNRKVNQLEKVEAVNKAKSIFKNYLKKRKTWKGVEEVGQTKRNIDAKVLDQLCKETLKQVKQFIERNRHHCEDILYKSEQEYPKTVNFIILQKILNKDMQMYLDRKKVIYLYLNFDRINRGFFKTSELLANLLVVKKAKPIKKQSYYLTDIQQLMSRIRTEMNLMFYSAHQLENDFDEFYSKRISQQNRQNRQDKLEGELDEEIFYEYVSQKCERKYSRYLINKLHKKIQFKQNIHFLFNKPNMIDLSKMIESMLVKRKKKRLLKKQNEVFYSFRTIILYLVTKSKSPKLTKQKLGQFLAENQEVLMYKSFYCVWRAYPNIINVERIKRQCKLHPLACYYKLRKTDQQYDKMYEYMIDLMPEDAECTYEKLQEKINMNLDFVLQTTKIKPLPLDRYDQVNYREAINQIFQPDFELDVRSYIHRKVSEKAYALWKSYKARKQIRLRAQNLTKMMISEMVPNPKASIDSNATSKKLKTQKSKSSLRSKKQQPAYNPESLQIVKWNIEKLLKELPITIKQTCKQFHTDEHTRQYLCVNKKQHYEYRTLTPRYIQHPIPGIVAMGSDLMFLNKNKMEVIKIKFFYKPGIEIIDFTTIGNDIVLLTSYFTLEFYSLAQESNYSYQTILLLDEIKNISFTDLDNICEDRMYSKFPIFIRNNDRSIIVNTTIVNNSIVIVNNESNSIEKKVIFNQKQHVLSGHTMKIIKILDKSSRKLQLFNEIIRELVKDEVSQSLIMGIISNELEELENQGKLEGLTITPYQVKGFVKNMESFSPALVNCILKQELGFLKQHKIGDSLTEVLNSLMSYMLTHNISLSAIISQIDKQNEGYIKIKNLKDFLLKITQGIYLSNQKQIDTVLKNMVVGKNVEYDTFCQIMKAWKYQIWELPYLILRDFIYVEDCGILFYTIEGHEQVYAKNVADGQVVAAMAGHNCTPSICFVQESYMLITGDIGTVRVWRIYEDLLRKYDQSPPWEITPFAVIPKAHDQMITSMVYLSRAHHIVTTSLDSTAKFWKINHDFQTSNSLFLQQVKRFYSNECIYLNSRSTNILLDSQGCRLQLLTLSKISKQINENNKYKYEMKIEVYQVQNTIIKTGPNNLHLQLPPKLKTNLQSYVDSLGVKKSMLLAKTINQIQHQTMKNNLISQNLQKTLYESVKNCFIFQDFSQLRNICQYLTRKNISSLIVRVLFQKFGIGIPKPNLVAAVKAAIEDVIKPEQVGMHFSDVIYISEDQIQFLANKLKANSKNNFLKASQALNIGSGFLNIVNFEKYQKVLQQCLKRNPNQSMMVDLSFIISAFQPLKLSSELDRIYAILRSVSVLMKQKGLKPWNIFTYNKTQLEKRKKVSQNQFQLFMSALGIGEQKIKFLVSYLSRNRNVSLDDYIYYTKLAWEVVGLQMNQSNFSKIFMKNSRLLQSNLQMFKLDSGIELEQTQFEQKVKNLQDSAAQSNLRESFSRKSSKKILRQQEVISQSHSLQKDSQIREKKRSIQKSESQKREQGLTFSMPMSSSNSRVSLSHQSQAKDQYSRQILVIVKKINQMMKNEGKTIWDITSISVPEFMENHLVTQSEYFNILSGIKSPIYLNDKLKLMGYIMRESDEYTSIDLNILFEIFSTSTHSIQRWGSKSLVNLVLPGEKYIISHVISKMNEKNFILEHSISQYFFSEKEQLTIEQILNCLAEKPFSMLGFCLKQFESLLMIQNKSAFTLEQLKSLIEQRIKKFNIKVQSKEITFIEQIIHQVDKRGLKLEQLVPKSMTNNGMVNFQSFRSIISQFFNQKQAILQNQFIKILLYVQEEKKNEENKQKLNQSPTRFIKPRGSPKKLSKSAKQLSHSDMIKKSEIKYKELLNYINKMIEQINKSSNSEKDGVKKFLKALQAKKLSLLLFFISLDRTRNYFINEVQFEAGLAQLKVTQNFWPSIKKKNPKKLFYFEIINYLVQNQFVSYKCVDSELEAAMTKFVKKFIRNDDIEAVYDRIRDKDSDQPFNTTYSSFEKSLKMGNLFKQQQILYIFGAFANAENLKSSNFGNDALIKDSANVHKNFNFKMFTDVINSYRNQNITKTPHYKICDFFKKRGISLLNEFTKWMQRNKKIKQIAEAIKLKQYTLPRELYMSFIKELGIELQQKQIKQMLGSFPNPLEFANFNQKLQQIYKKGNSNIQAEQITAYLQQIYKKIKKLNVTTVRLFADFSTDKFKMNINQFGDLIKFLEIGLTKIQNKLIFNYIDVENKGYITVNELENSLEDAGEILQKQEDEYELDFIIEKLVLNKQKFALKPSRITYNMDRAIIIFSPVLTNEEIVLLHRSAQEYFKSSEITEKNMEQFIVEKQKESKAKKDKKYKELIINFLKFLKKSNLEVKEAFYYFSKDTGSLTKNKFLLSYQSLGLKSNIAEINALYAYLDQSKIGNITLQKWQDKLNVIEYEKDNAVGVSGEELQVFYKVKLILSDIYLIFIRKLYKSKQIEAYFDVNGNGEITHEQFLSSLDQLGMHLQENIQGKLLNYLDKQRLGNIQVSNLVYELQSCLSSKTKLILQTKTSCIFKQKIHLVQEKQAYFIERLVKAEYFLNQGDKLQSCILVTDFVDVIKDFGIVLGQDEFNDVQRNFKFNKQNLQLYPLYFMFIHIFRTYQNSLSSDQMERIRYQKLFQTMVKNGLSMKFFQKMRTVQETQIFLSQLKIFTPIQIKLMLESVAIQGSNLIDVQLLVQKTRDSFLKAGQWFKSSMLSDFGSDRIHMMKEWLKQQLEPKKVTGILRANSGKLGKQNFQSLILKLGIVLKKSDVSELFSAFSKGQDFVLIEELINANPQVKLIKEESNAEQIKYSRLYNILLDHICKSLDFKGVSLEEGWEKYFINYGFISEQSFYSFLDEIGFNFKDKQFEKFVPQFIQNYKKQYKSTELKVSDIESMMKKNNHVPQRQSLNKKYYIQSEAYEHFTQLIRESTQFTEGFEKHLQQQGINPNRIPANQIFSYLKIFFKKQISKSKSQLREKQLTFFTNQLVKKSELNANQFINAVSRFLKNFLAIKYRRDAIKTQPEEEVVLLNDPSSSSFQKSVTNNKSPNLNQFQGIVKRICERNFIQSYQNIVQKFEHEISSLQVPIQNIYRLSLNLVVEKLIDNDYLLFIKPKLWVQQESSHEHRNKKHHYKQHSQKFNMKIVPNLIIDKEEFLSDQAIFFVNDKYYAMTVNQKKDFQSFAIVSNLLDESLIFLRAKNYYLWEPNQVILPKQSINFRWKFIPICLLKICNQLNALEEYGYALPHLRWAHLHSRLGISRPIYPAHADSTGKLHHILHEDLFKLDDAYCAPELFRKRNNLSMKINTWIFGCIMYEFIWGHSPNSFLLLLLQYIESRHSNFDLAEVLKMEELPSDFKYTPFKFNKIKETIALEHELKAEGIPDDFENNIIYFGLRGLVKNLEILYGSEYMYYQKQFQIFEKLHQIILSCLDPNPETRPAMKHVLQKLTQLMQEEDCRNFNYDEYVEVINSHSSTEKLNKDFIDPLKICLKNENTSELEGLCQIFNKVLLKIKGSGKINQIYMIPKRYPWPEQDSPDIYDRQILANKNIIRSNLSYSESCLIQNENCLEMLVNLYVMLIKQTNGANEKHAKIFDSLLKSLMLIIQMLRSYENSFSGYVENILQAFIQLYYRQPFCFTSDASSQQRNSKDGLMIMSSNGVEQQRALSMMKNIVYLDGSGNIQYLPIYHFLLTKKKYQLLYEYFYSSIDLNLSMNSKNQPTDRRVLAVNFFRDRIYAENFWEILKYLKVDILMLKLLDKQQLAMHLLLFYKDFTSSPSCQQFSLVHSNVLYLKLGALLTKKMTPIQYKSSVIQIATNIIRLKNPKIIKRMTEPVFELLREIFKLMIEPSRDTPAHEQYEQLGPVLAEFVYAFKQLSWYSKILQKLQGSETILSALQKILARRDAELESEVE